MVDPSHHLRREAIELCRSARELRTAYQRIRSNLARLKSISLACHVKSAGLVRKAIKNTASSRPSPDHERFDYSRASAAPAALPDPTVSHRGP
jgi:hypothetical protein